VTLDLKPSNKAGFSRKSYLPTGFAAVAIFTLRLDP